VRHNGVLLVPSLVHTYLSPSLPPFPLPPPLPLSHTHTPHIVTMPLSNPHRSHRSHRNLSFPPISPRLWLKTRVFCSDLASFPSYTHSSYPRLPFCQFDPTSDFQNLLFHLLPLLSFTHREGQWLRGGQRVPTITHNQHTSNTFL